MTELIDLVRDALADRYDVEREIGRGGMASVFLAGERHPSRKVAIKVLEPELATQIARERFLREVNVAATLTHPNIVPIFAAGEAGGLLYYVMPYVSGPTLRARLRTEGTIEIPEAIRLAAEIADALDYAHDHDVIHRDIKPENILLQDGHALVADFGIARAVKAACSENLTIAGFPIGTPGYMSPEQAAGSGEVDRRSDVYSLGCVVFEMISGKRPFRGSSPEEMLSARFNEPTPRLSRVESGIPRDLDTAVRKAMSLDINSRFATTGDFVKAMTGDQLPATLTRDSGQFQRGAVHAVAVLPFANLSSDPENEYFSDGITDDIITQLSKIGGLRVTSRTSVMRYKNTDKNVRQIATELGVSTVLEGTVRKAGNRVRIVAQLVDALSDAHIWAETYDRELTDIFEIQTDVAEKIAGALSTTLTASEHEQLCQKPTENIEAYNAYLHGRFYWSRFTEPDLRRAAEFFQKAIDLDPSFARAYAGLADTYLLLGSSFGADRPAEAFPLAREAAEKALELCECVGETYATLANIHMFYEWDWRQAEEEIRRSVELEDSNPKAHVTASVYYSATGRHEDAVKAARDALRIDPVGLPTNYSLGMAYYWARSYDRAVEQFKRTLDLSDAFAPAHAGLGWTLLQRGKANDAVLEFRRAADLTDNAPPWMAAAGVACAAAGDLVGARRALGELESMSAERYVSSADFALVYGYMGEMEVALDCLHRAREERATWLTFLKVEPLFDIFRGEPRFEDLVSAMGFDGA